MASERKKTKSARPAAAKKKMTRKSKKASKRGHKRKSKTAKPSAKRSVNSGKKRVVRKPSDKHTATNVKKNKPAPGKSPPRLVAIGASAGSLEPLEQFFHEMPADTGMAFVVVQHLSPDFRSMMGELLARHSIMMFVQVENGMSIEPNTVYLNPPRSELSIKNGRFFAKPCDNQEVVNLPIDILFKSIAVELKKHAIGIIMSGTGSDGSKGCDAIKAAGGTVIVQDPASAKFTSMPSSVIDRESATAVARPSEMATLLSELLKGKDIDERADSDSDSGSGEEDEPNAAIVHLLQKRFGADFGYYKQTTVARRIKRRALMSNMGDLKEYVAYLKSNDGELDAVYSDLLIGVTQFFRDKKAWEVLSDKVLIHLCKDMGQKNQIRIWVAGCATGEEAYSTAIAISEYARITKKKLNVKIFATDLYETALQTAANGLYTSESLSEVPKNIKDRYFQLKGGRYSVRPELRRLVVFSPHNLTRDPPFTKLDLVTCRNLLIYLNEVAQRKVLALFHFSLKTNGYLFLGPSETTWAYSEEFDTVDHRWRIFSKIRDIRLLEATHVLPISVSARGVPAGKTKPALPAPADSGSMLPKTADFFQRRQALAAYEAFLSEFSPATLILSKDGEIIHIVGEAHKYLSFGPGSYPRRASEAVLSDLRYTIATGLERTSASAATPFRRRVKVNLSSEDEDVSTIVTVTIKRMPSPVQGSDYFFAILFDTSDKEKAKREDLDVPVATTSEDQEFLGQRIVELETDLRFTEESLQSMIEEMETSNEELQATNEELMSANEELQSTNEELHSVNEELYTVSSEHQRKIEELTELSNDMDNLLESTEIGVIFLDRRLKIRRYTPAATLAFNLLPHDIERPIDHVTPKFSNSHLLNDIRKVEKFGKKIETGVTVDHKDYLIQIRPYQALDSMEGIVLTIFDVTELKEIERAFKKRNLELARINESQKQFSHIVGHDLKAPLRIIKNSAEWIKEDIGEVATKQLKKHLALQQKHTLQLDSMLDDLLAYATLDLSMDRAEEVDIEELILDTASKIADEKKLKIKLALSTKYLHSTRSALRVVFQNLLLNAVSYAEKKPVTVKISARDRGEFLEFDVEDNGVGIPKAYREKVFLPFRKLQQKTLDEGTGMGLATVKKAVTSLGGSIDIVDEPSRKAGTTFRFTWPKKVVKLPDVKSVETLH